MDNRDLPIRDLSQDKFGVDNYVHALCQFISNCDTPITISLQGEWGSGKTSFMNMIENELCRNTLPREKRFDSIWLHTWELFLEDNYEEATKKIVLTFINQLASRFETLKKGLEREKILEETKNFAKAFANSVLNLFNVGNKATEELIDRFLGDYRYDSIKSTRNSFENFLAGIINDSGNGVTNRGFIVFIDDLDRIEPRMAVTLLEALKNLFDIKNCIFVLAIDYDVVERGVEQKYGIKQLSKRNISKEYFDKLIQLSFVIPTQKYDIQNMLRDALQDIGFFSWNYDYRKYEDDIIQIFHLATNNNPRSIKRLLNMIRLMILINENKLNEHPIEYRILELILLSFQLSFPDVFQMLIRNNNYINWDKQFFINGEYKNIPEDLKLSLGLDADWKEIIFQITSQDTVLNNNYGRILRLMNLYSKFFNACKAMPHSEYLIKTMFSDLDIININSTGNLTLMYNGEDYDYSSQTQFNQGNYLIDSIDLNNYDKVLDVGCGNGKTTIEMWKRNTRMHIDAFDYSQSQIDVALNHYKSECEELAAADNNGEIHFFRMDALNLSESGKYDLIFSNSALHWILDAKKMYALLFEALQPNGTLAVHQGGKDCYIGLHKIVRKAIDNLGYGKYFENWQFPAFYPTKDELKDLLEKTGFRNISIESVQSNGDEHTNLVENFEKASMISYRQQLKTEEEYDNLVKEYYRICNTEPVNRFTHRLYIFAIR